jgi:D-glycero-alpha-D-manno-heptose 1-phosphate guanylyltransferase
VNLPALILAGGFGTRLRGVLPDLPKLLAPINGRPFLRYLLDRLERAGVREVVLCTGYRADQIQEEFERCPTPITLKFSHETQPLGTGGALRQALNVTDAEVFLVLNGDSAIDCDLQPFIDWHYEHGLLGSLLLTHVDDASRFGTVLTDERGVIQAFREKEGRPIPGWINAGVYLLSRRLLEPLAEGQAYSLEKELFPRWLQQGLGGYRVQAAFLDIGTPESLAQASAFLSGGRAAS